MRSRETGKKCINVLLIGSGGREHAIAWKVAQSAVLDRLFIAPGNAGTAACGENVSLKVNDPRAIVDFCKTNGIQLVIIGPEAPLAEGLADSLRSAGIRVFGPSKLAARIESSKVFAKQFMDRHGIPTAQFIPFKDFSKACQHVEEVDYPVVIKASGLAAGKGVSLPPSRVEACQKLKEILVQGEFGEAGREVVIEERLAGPEVSLMVFTDGVSVKSMPAAQDHKRLLDGDEGPNTGGMGAYAPAPFLTPKLLEEAMEKVIKPAISGLHREGIPFLGVLYAGLMLTEQGLKVLEFNCRFGDPETQVVLPLLDSDLLEVIEACVDGKLEKQPVNWREESAACVVLASAGYPGNVVTGRVVQGLESLPAGSVCFHAGTKLDCGNVVTNGGRVCGVMSCAISLEDAVKQAYKSVSLITFEGMQYRHDIASQELEHRSTYAISGVSIDAGNRAVELMKEAVKSTYTPAVLAGIGSFGGLFDASLIKGMKNPVLVASTDGVGTKVKLAREANHCHSLGHDIVNHCINDILVQGARPLFFLDYFATSVLHPEQTADVVTGIAEACREAGMSLIGGETAEMPGVYQVDEFDLAGTILGVVERDCILPKPDMQAGNLIIGLASSGTHTNGYSLIRKIFMETPLSTIFPELGIPLGEALLKPHRSYYPILYPNLPMVKALAHLTGGGFMENIPRVLPEGLSAVIHRKAWDVPPLFQLIRKLGDVPNEEMYRVFNMGIGMVAIVDRENGSSFQKAIPEPTWIIGELADGERKVFLD